MPAPRRIDVKEMLELWADGWTHAELAERYGVARENVTKAIKRHRAKLRLGIVPTVSRDEYDPSSFHLVGSRNRWADVPWNGPGARFPGASHREDA